MSCYDDPDQHLVVLNRRARLIREMARGLQAAGVDAVLWYDLLRVADEVATEAALLVAWYGAAHGHAFYHGDPDDGEDPDQLYEGWALPDGEVQAAPTRKVETVDPGGVL